MISKRRKNLGRKKCSNRRGYFGKGGGLINIDTTEITKDTMLSFHKALKALSYVELQLWMHNNPEKVAKYNRLAPEDKQFKQEEDPWTLGIHISDAKTKYAEFMKMSHAQLINWEEKNAEKVQYYDKYIVDADKKFDKIRAQKFDEFFDPILKRNEEWKRELARHKHKQNDNS
jgi:hypothetical protein